MTKDDIIRAAFKVWGREFYKTTSLNEIALELGVSKAALYRHFKDKDDLLDAMYSPFFDECASFIKKDFDKAAKAASIYEANIIRIRAIANYYLRNGEAFIFSTVRVYNGKGLENILEEFLKRGIKIERKALDRPVPYPSAMQLMLTTMIFHVADFYNQNYKSDETASDEAVDRVLAQIEERITKGLCLDRQKISALDYELMEKRASLAGESTENNSILRAVAEAVAEAGPWNASMEMVAKRSGLSKSGLYAHFKNKQDMMGEFLLTEFNRIANFAKSQVETTAVHEEQLFLAIASIVHYLRSRPEIFAAIDWIKTRQLNLGKTVPGRLYRIIKSIKVQAVREQDPHLLFWVTQWVLFMIVNTLALWPSKPAGNCDSKGKVWAQNAAEVPNESFRILFRFIALGLEGIDNI